MLAAPLVMQLAVASVFGLLQARHSNPSSGIQTFGSILLVVSFFSTTLFVFSLPFAYQFGWKNHTPAMTTIVAIAIWFVGRTITVWLTAPPEGLHTAPPQGAARTKEKSR